MKLETVTKLDKRNTTRFTKKLDYDVMFANHDIISFFQFMADLGQPTSRIPDECSATLTFTLIATFYLTKTENRAKNL